MSEAKVVGVRLPLTIHESEKKSFLSGPEPRAGQDIGVLDITEKGWRCELR